MSTPQPQPHDDKLLIDHQYDGIQELDNNLPQWWLYGFYFTIVFGVVYLLYFGLAGGGPSMEQEYLREMAAAGYRVPPVDSDVATAREEYLLTAVAVLAGVLLYVVAKVIRIDRASR